MTSTNTQVLGQIFEAIERRDAARLAELCQPNVEFVWPPSLPYGNPGRAAGVAADQWASTWVPLQPTAAERALDLRVVASAGDEVVGLWRQRGVSPRGERFDGEVLGLYRFRDGKLERAQMFHFDTAALARYLSP